MTADIPRRHPPNCCAEKAEIAGQVDYNGGGVSKRMKLNEEGIAMPGEIRSGLLHRKSSNSCGQACYTRSGIMKRQKLNESGITLQTLVITAVLVTVPVVASVLFYTIASDQSEALESSQSDTEGLCQPWEVHKTSLAARGYGGTQGYGGVFSSSIGCMAVCYYSIPSDRAYYPHVWQVANRQEAAWSPSALDLAGWTAAEGLKSTLSYDDSNRVPAAREVRLGVAYNRVPPADADDFNKFWPDFGYYRAQQDENAVSPRIWESRDPDPIIRMVGYSGTPDYTPPIIHWPGSPVPLEWRDQVDPDRQWSKGPWSASLHVYEPNFWSPDHGTFADRDEEWEVRADPGREVCEIVDTARNDEIMLTSAREYDPSNPYPN